MIKNYSRLLLTLLLFITFPISSFAASFEEGKEAYHAGDFEKALSILKPMAVKGHAKAQLTLGIMYDFGHGVEKDPVKAISWYEKAAAQGNSSVQHDLGVKYFKGQGIPQDYDKASAWWRMAADNGVAVSQYNLGIMYARGLGLEKDNAQAVNWYSKAASQGHPHAQYSLGVMYSFGQGITQDYVKGLSYFQDAAEQNIAQAQYNLAVLLEHGRGTDVDLVGAKKWYQRASENGIEQATERLASFDSAEKAQEKTESSTSSTVQVTETVKVEKEISPSEGSKVTDIDKEKSVATVPTPVTVAVVAPAKMEPLTIPETEITKNDPSQKSAPIKSLPENHQVISGAEIEVASARQKSKVPEIKIEEPVKTEKIPVKQKPAPTKKIVKKVVTPKPVKVPSVPTKNESVVNFSQVTHDEDWIKSQNPGHYALQMIALRKEEFAQKYMNELELEGEKAIYKSSMHGRTIYKVIYGNFANHRESLRGRRALPTKYRDAKPFPRSFEFIQNDIKE